MEASEDGLKILLAESTVTHAHPNLDRLRADGHDIHHAQSADEPLSTIDREACDMVLINLDQPAISTTEIDAAKRKLDSDRASALGVTSRSNATLCAAGRKHCVTWAELPNRINEFSGKARAETPRPVIHISAALDCTDGDVELLQSLIELYFEQQPGLIEQICDGVAQSDSELNEHGAHSVKDCMSVFAAEDTRQAPSFWKPLDENRTGPKRMRHGRI